MEELFEPFCSNHRQLGQQMHSVTAVGSKVHSFEITNHFVVFDHNRNSQAHTWLTRHTVENKLAQGFKKKITTTNTPKKLDPIL